MKRAGEKRGMIAIILGEERAEHLDIATSASHKATRSSHSLSLLCFPMRYAALRAS